MHILGISAFYHDSAAVLIQDGVLIAAAQEERFTRAKHDASFPEHAARFCLSHAGITPGDLDVVAFHEKPLWKLERILESFFAVAPRGATAFLRNLPNGLQPKLFARSLLRDGLGRVGPLPASVPLRFAEHHLSHAASAFFPSPFEEAAILTVDGVGEWATATIGHGSGASISVAQELHFPHSLGLFYSAMTWFLGFDVNDGEYKVMGLAPYGDETSDRHRRFRETIDRELVGLGVDGSVALHLERFRFLEEHRLIDDDAWSSLFGLPRRRPGDPLTADHADLALAVQRTTEEALLRMAREARRLTGSRRLCLAGGVALNCVGNRHILDAGIFDEVWIQPAAGDAGGALGAALAVHHVACGLPRTPTGRDQMLAAQLGPSYEPAEVERIARRLDAPFVHFDSHRALCAEAAGLLADGKVLGWFQGRAEWGPRALGNRSILADPRDPGMQARLNLAIKQRESFRPFAPAVLVEDAHDWFDLGPPSPYMLLTAAVTPDHLIATTGHRPPGIAEQLAIRRSDIPAVTHVDGSARVQTVDRETNPHFAALLDAFKATTGCGVIVNTSFNLAGEPIVTTPYEAYRCFMATGMDALVMGPYLFLKERQPPPGPGGPAPSPPPSSRPGNGRGRDLETIGGLALALLVFGFLTGRRPAQIAAAVLLATALAAPSVGHMIANAWNVAARTFGKVVARIGLALLFISVLTPLALVRRALGRVHPAFAKGSPTTGRWIVREHRFEPRDFERTG